MHVEYKKENGMVNMKLRKPYTTATIWSSGKVTCAGAKSEQDAYIAARRYCRLLQRMQFKVKMTNYRVVNVLATCNMPFGVDISKLAEKHQKDCSYEPELHPGATYKIKDLKVTLKLFTTGSITLTSPSVLVAQQAINRIYPVLVEFKRNLNSNCNNNINNNSNNNNNLVTHNPATTTTTNSIQSPQSVVSTIKLQNNNFTNKLTESITAANQQPWVSFEKKINLLKFFFC
jgi:transcription initiation factor TFIID TATA-box-binding protein